MALFLSPQFDFKLTYMLVAGIAGVNPHCGTLGSAFFARFAVQVALQYELDARQIPSGWKTGYWAQGTSAPGIKPAKADLYGTEVFELSTPLRTRVMALTKHVKLNDSSAAIAYRAKFDYAPANQKPVVTTGDVATSDVYFAGSLLADSFGNYTKLITDGKARYCTTAQEDNATLESLVRATKAGFADYSRAIVLRTASDFDRAPQTAHPTHSTEYNAFIANQGGFAPSLQNLYLTGYPIVRGIAQNWNAWKDGVETQSKRDGYYGDDLGTLRWTG